MRAGLERVPAQLDGVVWAGNETGSRSERNGLDVVQNGIAVASVDRDARTITPVNTKLAEGRDDDAVTVKDSRVVMGGNTARERNNHVADLISRYLPMCSR